MSKLLSLVLGVCKFFNTNAQKRAENKPKKKGGISQLTLTICFNLLIDEMNRLKADKETFPEFFDARNQLLTEMGLNPSNFPYDRLS